MKGREQIALLPGWRHLGDSVRQARLRAGHASLEAWSERIGVSGKTLGKLERGNPVRTATLVAIEAALGWPPGYARNLLDGGAAQQEPNGERRYDLSVTADELYLVTRFRAMGQEEQRDLLKGRTA